MGEIAEILTELPQNPRELNTASYLGLLTSLDPVIPLLQFLGLRKQLLATLKLNVTEIHGK